MTFSLVLSRCGHCMSSPTSKEVAAVQEFLTKLLIIRPVLQERLADAATGQSGLTIEDREETQHSLMDLDLQVESLSRAIGSCEFSVAGPSSLET